MKRSLTIIFHLCTKRKADKFYAKTFHIFIGETKTNLRVFSKRGSDAVANMK